MKFMGIDWKDKGYTVRIIDKEGKDISGAFEVEKKKEDLSKLMEKIRKHCKAEEVLIGIERERDVIVDYLLAHGYKVFLLCPNMIKSFRERHSVSGQYTDDLDSYVIADAVRTDRKRLSLIKPKNDKTRKIEFLLRHRRKAIEDKNRLMNRLTAYIKEYFPVFLDCFSDISRPTALSFLKVYPSYKDIKDLSKEDIRNFLKEHNYYRKIGVSRIWKAINKEQIKVDSIVEKERSRSALFLIKRLEMLNEEIKEYEQELTNLLEDDEDAEVFKSLPGVADVLTPGLMIIFGEKRDRYKNAQEINSLCGMVPLTKSSGKWESHLFRFGCNLFYRNILTKLAYTSLNESKWARAYYNSKRAEGKSHYHALRCLARIWVKVAFALWKKREKYDENKHMAAIQKHNINNKLVRRSA
jgi:transposase